MTPTSTPRATTPSRQGRPRRPTDDDNFGINIVIDFVHVIEKLWAAAWNLHPPVEPAAEDWVATCALALLAGNTQQVITDRLDITGARWGLAGAEAILNSVP